ncbi:GGDEF domain-containing protein [Diaphorobacter ruginosibacter]|uniref:diguanylate cyclase n=1 Tax=Diaphorobacter ruginosibacter TaxID=1715720 RepID=A0A7G9RNP9_9BURK|nr:GGDEF domain-containing protein [Diaphorobacter ruginosibacter]QNN57224.1 GGDEF domain-containing protein [Diaphorobacter ruginosibacter]
MTAPVTDLPNTFGMIAIAAWTASWVLWVLGRQYVRQGMPLAIASTALLGLSYLGLALHGTLEWAGQQVFSRVMASAALAAFTIALQRFRQSREWQRDSATVLIPLLGSLALAALFLPKDPSAFHRMHAVIAALQTAYTLVVLAGMRSNTPGPGWVLVTVATTAQLLALLPLILLHDRPSAAFEQHGLPGSTPVWWVVVGLLLYLALAGTSIGFLVMQRDREAANAPQRAELDPLTQLPRRTAWLRTLGRAADAARSDNKPVAVMLIDIDHFRRFNGRHGHLLGDQAIRSLADVLKQQSRGRDVVARFGGDAFILVLPSTNSDEALTMAQRLVRAIRNLPILPTGGERLGVTVSIGIHSCIPAKGEGCAPLVAAAEAALRKAKSTGRDRVVLSAPPPLATGV